MLLAVHGLPLSGKTTFARMAQEQDGYAWLNYTDKLKIMFVQELQERGVKGVTLAVIRRDKGFWRPFLQTFGTTVGYDKGAFVEDMVRELDGGRDAVFDNVRFPAQYEKLAPLGFTLVRFTVSPAVQAARARAAGVAPEDLLEALKHEAEKPLPHYPHELIVDGDKPADEVYREIMAYTRFGQAA